MQNSFEHNTTFSSFHFSSRKVDCCNFEDGNMANYIVEDDCNQSYVFLQQQHFTPPPVDFQDGSQLMQHKGSIIRNSQEYLKRNRLNNSWVWIILFLSDSIIQSIIKLKIIYYVFFLVLHLSLFISYIEFMHPLAPTNINHRRSYELSQDLLDKQIELLERKYGGVRARRAAIVIQRAFRHYKMVKKFASITAMVKAEKRLSNRSSMQPFIREYNNDQTNKTAAQTMRVCAM